MAIWMLIDVRKEMLTALDQRLAASAQMVAALMEQTSLSDPRHAPNEQLDVIGRDGLACEVSLLRGEVIVDGFAKTANSPGLSKVKPGYSTSSFGGKEWRIYVLERGSIRVATADRVDNRKSLLQAIALAAGLPFIVALLGSLLVLWFGVGRGLLPIEQLRATLVHRSPDDDSPLNIKNVPSELIPLTNGLQTLLGRVKALIERERRFVDDAAHELRTPLTVIKTHLQVFHLASKFPEKEAVASAALSNVDHGVERLQHTLEQLLLLSKLDSQLPVHIGSGKVRDAVYLVLQEIASAWQIDRVKVNYHSGSEDSVAMPQEMLVCVLRNLIDNALRYSSPDSLVVLEVKTLDNSVIFVIRDEGRGLSDTELKKASLRFWRKNSASPGSGLGLSIVEKIAMKYNAVFTLSVRKNAIGTSAKFSCILVE